MRDPAPTSADITSGRHFELLLDRNRHFVTNEFPGPMTLAVAPTIKTIIVGCVDPRVEPSKIFGLDTGEAVVIRNIGGRITPKFFADMIMLRLVAGATGGTAPGEGWNVIVLHHTDCGITRLEPYPDLLADYFGVDVADLDHAHVMDPFQAVVTDIETLRANPFSPRSSTSPASSTTSTPARSTPWFRCPHCADASGQDVELRHRFDERVTTHRCFPIIRSRSNPRCS